MFTALPKIKKLQPFHVEQLFASDPTLRPLKQPDLWALVSPCVYHSEAKGVVITCPKGAVTDLASTPKVLQWIPFIDDDGQSRLAGVVHDLIYKLGRDRGKDFADDVLREMCLDLGMNRFQAGAFYQGVHLFGTHAWGQDGRNAPYGDPTRSNFVEQADYDAWRAAGATIYSVPT